MESFNTKTEHNIVVCKIRFGVHSNSELKTIINHISAIEGVDEVKRLSDEEDFFSYNDSGGDLPRCVSKIQMLH